ncbi:MAG: ABC transporter ATP-binding protein [Bryobacteraceae bacterium]
MPVIEAIDLRKQYGDVTAVNGVSFQVEGSKMIGLLGPNGAGKTTTISMITGLVRPDSGLVLINGRPLSGDDDPVKRNIGLVPQDLALYDELSAQDNLYVFGSLYGLTGSLLESRSKESLELVGLTDRRRHLVGTFSGGMKRRLNIACAIMHDPGVLLLDEPTVGVDPQSRNAIFDNLEELKRRGKTIVYTTHYMEEAERLCDRIVVIDHGKVIANDTLHGLYRSIPNATTLSLELEASCDVDGLRSVAGVEFVETRGAVLRVGLEHLTHSSAVLAWLTGRGARVQHIATERASLESVFLTLTGRSLRD